MHVEKIIIPTSYLAKKVRYYTEKYDLAVHTKSNNMAAKYKAKADLLMEIIEDNRDGRYLDHSLYFKFSVCFSEFVRLSRKTSRKPQSSKVIANEYEPLPKLSLLEKIQCCF